MTESKLGLPATFNAHQLERNADSEWKPYITDIGLCDSEGSMKPRRVNRPLPRASSLSIHRPDPPSQNEIFLWGSENSTETTDVTDDITILSKDCPAGLACSSDSKTKRNMLQPQTVKGTDAKTTTPPSPPQPPSAAEIWGRKPSESPIFIEKTYPTKEVENERIDHGDSNDVAEDESVESKFDMSSIGEVSLPVRSNIDPNSELIKNSATEIESNLPVTGLLKNVIHPTTPNLNTTGFTAALVATSPGRLQLQTSSSASTDMHPQVELDDNAINCGGGSSLELEITQEETRIPHRESLEHQIQDTLTGHGLDNFSHAEHCARQFEEMLKISPPGTRTKPELLQAVEWLRSVPGSSLAGFQTTQLMALVQRLVLKHVSSEKGTSTNQHRGEGGDRSYPIALFKPHDETVGFGLFLRDASNSPSTSPAIEIYRKSPLASHDLARDYNVSEGGRADAEYMEMREVSVLQRKYSADCIHAKVVEYEYNAKVSSSSSFSSRDEKVELNENGVGIDWWNQQRNADVKAKKDDDEEEDDDSDDSEREFLEAEVSRNWGSLGVLARVRSVGVFQTFGEDALEFNGQCESSSEWGVPTNRHCFFGILNTDVVIAVLSLEDYESVCLAPNQNQEQDEKGLYYEHEKTEFMNQNMIQFHAFRSNVNPKQLSSSSLVKQRQILKQINNKFYFHFEWLRSTHHRYMSEQRCLLLLERTTPFNMMNPKARRWVASQSQERYYESGSKLTTPGLPIRLLLLIEHGAIETSYPLNRQKGISNFNFRKSELLNDMEVFNPNIIPSRPVTPSSSSARSTPPSTATPSNRRNINRSSGNNGGSGGGSPIRKVRKRRSTLFQQQPLDHLCIGIEEVLNGFETMEALISVQERDDGKNNKKSPVIVSNTYYPTNSSQNTDGLFLFAIRRSAFEHAFLQSGMLRRQLITRDSAAGSIKWKTPPSIAAMNTQPAHQGEPSEPGGTLSRDRSKMVVTFAMTSPHATPEPFSNHNSEKNDKTQIGALPSLFATMEKSSSLKTNVSFTESSINTEEGDDEEEEDDGRSLPHRRQYYQEPSPARWGISPRSMNESDEESAISLLSPQRNDQKISQLLQEEYNEYQYQLNNGASSLPFSHHRNSNTTTLPTLVRSSSFPTPSQVQAQFQPMNHHRHHSLNLNTSSINPNLLDPYSYSPSSIQQPQSPLLRKNNKNSSTYTPLSPSNREKYNQYYSNDGQESVQSNNSASYVSSLFSSSSSSTSSSSTATKSLVGVSTDLLMNHHHQHNKQHRKSDSLNKNSSFNNSQNISQITALSRRRSSSIWSGELNGEGGGSLPVKTIRTPSKAENARVKKLMKNLKSLNFVP